MTDQLPPPYNPPPPPPAQRTLQAPPGLPPAPLAPPSAPPTAPPSAPPAHLGAAGSPVDLYWKNPGMRGRLIGGAFAALGFLTFVSSFLPFASYFGENVAGAEGDGLFTLFLGLFLIGLGVVRFLGFRPGLLQLGWSATAFVTAGLVTVIAFSVMLNVSDVGANIGVGLVFTLLLGLAALAVAGADLVALFGEVKAVPPHPIEATVILVLGILSVIGVSAFGPAAAAMGALTLQRHGQAARSGQAPDPQRNLVLAGLICGGIGTLWLAIFSIAVLASS